MGKGYNPLPKLFNVAMGVLTGGRVSVLSGLKLHMHPRVNVLKKLESEPQTDRSGFSDFLVALPGAVIVGQPREDQGVTTFKVRYEGKIYDATRHPDGSVVLEDDYETIEVSRRGADYVVARTPHEGDVETELVQDDGKFIERRYADGYIERTRERHHRLSRVEPKAKRQRRQDFKLKMRTKPRVGRSVIARGSDLKIPKIKVDGAAVTPPEIKELRTEQTVQLKAASAAPILQGAQLHTNMPMPTEMTLELSAARYTQPTPDVVGALHTPYMASPGTTPSPSSPHVVHEDVARQAMFAGVMAMQEAVPIVIVPGLDMPVEGDRTAGRDDAPRVGSNPFKLTRTSQGVVMSTEGVVVPPGAVPVPFVPMNAGGMVLAFSPRVIANSMVTLRVQPRIAGLIANILARLRGGKEHGRIHTKYQLPTPLAHTIKPDAAADRDAVERPHKSKESDEDGEERGQRDQDDSHQEEGQPEDAQGEDAFVDLPDYSHITFTR